jgi:hypothetical protein
MMVRKITNLKNCLLLGAVLSQASSFAFLPASTLNSIKATITKNVDDTVNQWTGAADTNWNNAANWSKGVVPTQQDNVIIIETINQPVVTPESSARALSITVNANAKLTIVTGATLRVTEAIDVDNTASLIVENNASLRQDYNVGNTGNITVYKNTNPLYRLDYTLWSSPVSGQQLKAFSPETTPNRFYEYTYGFSDALGGNADVYMPVNATTTAFKAGKGYLIRMPNASSVSGYNEGTTPIAFNGVFTGVPHNGEILIPLSSVGQRYTAVGNPYASPINVAQFFDKNSEVLDGTTTLYMWRKKNDGSVSTYAKLTQAALVANAATNDKTGQPTPGYTNGGQDQAGFFEGSYLDYLLAPGQGFLIRTKPGLTNAHLSFTNVMREDAPTDGKIAFLRQQKQDASRLWLNLTGDKGGFSQTAIVYMPKTTTGLDYGFDGAHLAEAAVPSLYSVAEKTDLTIQARGEFNSSDVVTLGYDAPQAGSYTISLDHTDGLFANSQDIYIKDNLLGKLHNIKDAAYNFTTEAGTFTNRFTVIYATEQALDTPQFNANSVVVFKQGTEISITSGTQEMTSVTVYDVRGRVLYNQNNINATQTTVSGLEAQQQLLIVEIATVNGKTSKKIIF